MNMRKIQGARGRNSPEVLTNETSQETPGLYIIESFRYVICGFELGGKSLTLTRCGGPCQPASRTEKRWASDSPSSYPFDKEGGHQWKTLESIVVDS
jgi:hypothetical protein